MDLFLLEAIFFFFIFDDHAARRQRLAKAVSSSKARFREERRLKFREEAAPPVTPLGEVACWRLGQAELSPECLQLFSGLTASRPSQAEEPCS